MVKLAVNSIAPDFEAKSVVGKNVQLAEYKNSYVLIAFLRYSACPWCNLAIHRLTMENPLLAENRCKTIAFIQAPENDIVNNIYKRHAITPPFDVIADNEQRVYKQYDVKPSLSRGLKHHIVNVPAWVRSVKNDGLLQQKIDKNYFLAPALFLVTPGDQKIIWHSYTANLYEHSTFSTIYDTIAEHMVHRHVTP